MWLLTHKTYEVRSAFVFFETARAPRHFVSNFSTKLFERAGQNWFLISHVPAKLGPRLVHNLSCGGGRLLHPLHQECCLRFNNGIRNPDPRLPSSSTMLIRCHRRQRPINLKLLQISYPTSQLNIVMRTNNNNINIMQYDPRQHVKICQMHPSRASMIPI